MARHHRAVLRPAAVGRAFQPGGQVGLTGFNDAPTMTLAAAVAQAEAQFDSGDFFRTLARRVACRTESQNADRGPELRAYLAEQIAPALAALGFATAIHHNPEPGAPPLLTAQRLEDPALPTVLFYGHGDVVRGHEGQWADGRDPWTLTAAAPATPATAGTVADGERWYGRGAADNKAQHSINLAALAAVMAARGGRLGFNAKWLVEMGEETGSPGLAEFCSAERGRLAADVLIASDGPRLRADRPTVFLGSRGVANFDLVLVEREGGHHSGNWGGLLRNPGTVLANAIASLVDGRGVIRVEGLRPPPIPQAVRAALADIAVGGGPGDPEVDRDWGEPGLTSAERVFGWNALEVLAYGCGNPAQPVNAIPPAARATLQLRFVVGTKAHRLREFVLTHLQAHGFDGITCSEPVVMAATRLDPDNAWVRLAMQSLQASTGVTPALLPNLGGSLPNDVFADILGLPTVWVPHSYPACSQHAPNEHVLPALMRQGLGMTAALLWAVGDQAATLPRRVGGSPGI
jgi:acetylornithine deacetylase/succinyl-diaminopimelate desuccinylase-like protein